MVSLIEAINYRCLHYVRQPLGDFHVLVGPNASGKTTFLDVVAFLGQLVSDGLEAAIRERTHNFNDLLWQRSGYGFELAVEAVFPEKYREFIREKNCDAVRYEVSIGINPQTGEVGINAEKVLLKKRETILMVSGQQEFPKFKAAPNTLMSPRARNNTQTVATKVAGGNDNFYSEVYQETGKGWAPAYKLGPRKSTLGNLPEDESKFPVSTWLKKFLSEGVQKLILNSLLIRKASPPIGQLRMFKPDGSNLPWVIENLVKTKPERIQDWIAHLQTALPDLCGIRTIERPDDRHRYVMLKYDGGLEVPSWMASDGTLRLLALTLPAYVPELRGVYLVEEPENGIHPRAVETMFQSLSSVYDAQILLATHSPVILSMVDASKVLCFAKTQEGATDIIHGDQHPALREWRGETNLGVLFAGGVLG